METTMDPRWQRHQQHVAGSGGEKSPSSGSSFSSRSPAQQEAAASIVFSASWVRITTPIGEGAFSRVYEGVYTNPETLEQSVVAVKILKKNMLKRRADCLRFIKEAKIMTKISQRNIVACYGIGKYDDNDPVNPGSLFIVQELVRGGNLLHKVYKQMLNRMSAVYTSQEALSWMIDVAQGMQYLHDVSDVKPMIIHRDLKLENIMLVPASSMGGTLAKLVDFGLHKVIDDRTKKIIKRVVSEASIGLFPRIRGAAHGNDELLDDEQELEHEMTKQVQPAGGSGEPGTSSGVGSTLTAAASGTGTLHPLPGALGVRRIPLRKASVLSDSPSMASYKEEDEEGGDADAPTPARTGSLQAVRSPLSRGCSSLVPNLSDGGAAEGAPTEVTRHGPPKRESSMQRLMAKMKEIKLRVIGGQTSVDSPPGTPKSNLSREPSAAMMVGPNDALSTSATSRVPEHLPALGGSPPHPVTHPPVDPEKLARNEALLNRLLAQQSVARAEQASAADDTTLLDASGRLVRKAAPRRAVTWVNEVRYNLTEAVGSWAYMAPEVVLGQPYNEKVDVFSFGVILFEVLNRKLMLVDEIKNDPRRDAQMYAERVAHGFRPDIPRRWPDKLRSLIGGCWAQDAHVRPNFVAVVDMLLELQQLGLVASLDAQNWGNNSAYI